VKFCDIWHDITDANDEEAYQILQGKLQPFMVNWLIEEQEKRKVRAPKALVSQIDGVTSETLGHNIETAIGEKPRQVGEKPNGDYIVECRDQKQLQKLMAMNGKKLRGGKYMRIQKLEQHLSTPETFEFIGRKLETRDKVDSCLRTHPGGGYNKAQREVRGGGARTPQQVPGLTHRPEIIHPELRPTLRG
jgi:hypothetical protein